MAIKLDELAHNPGRTERKYIYQDLFLDLTEQALPKGSSLINKTTQGDIKVAYDEAAIMNSIKNIFTTSPGEKILVPDFGVNLTHWLFNGISEDNAHQIGEAIVAGIEAYEPRVIVKTVNVQVDYEMSQYNIKLVLTVPSLNIINKSYDAILNQPGFDVLTHNIFGS